MGSKKPRALAHVLPFTEAYHAPLETEPLRKDQEDALHQELVAAVRRALDEEWCPCPSDPPQSKPGEAYAPQSIDHVRDHAALTEIPPHLIVLALRVDRALKAAAERRTSAGSR